MREIVVTSAAGNGATSQLAVHRLGVGRFVTTVELKPGRNTFAAVAKTFEGTRMRAAVVLDVPRG